MQTPKRHDQPLPVKTAAVLGAQCMPMLSSVGYCDKRENYSHDAKSNHFSNTY